MLRSPGQIDRMGIRSRKNVKWPLQPHQLLWKLSDRAREWSESRTLTPALALGKKGEDLAHRYLQRAGFKVVARNFKPGEDSEVDIVARLGELLVFVEVKTLASMQHSAPDRAVGPDKERHILRAARSFATRAGVEWSRCRFDIISVVLDQPPTIRHFENAFSPII